MAKTGTVSGASVSRSGWQFTGSWSCVNKSTDQDARFYLNGANVNIGGSMAWNVSGKTYRDLAKGTNSKSVWLSPGSYYPNTGTRLSSVGYSVRAKASGKSLGDWLTFYFYVYAPRAPQVPVPAMYDNQNDTFAYTWDRNASDGDVNTTNFMFTDFTYETVLMDRGVDPDWSLVDSQKITVYNPSTGRISTDQPSRVTTTGTSVVIVEAQESLTNNKRRYFRVKARGPAGDSGFTQVDHVFGAPDPVVLNDNEASLISSDENGTVASIGFNVPNNGSHPVDEIEYQYAMVTPASTTRVVTDSNGVSWKRTTLSLPVGYNSWTTYKTFTGVGRPDVLSMKLSSRIPDNACLFVRINTKHDDIVTEGSPILVNNKVDTITGTKTITKYVEQTITKTVKEPVEYKLYNDPFDIRYRTIYSDPYTKKIRKLDPITGRVVEREIPVSQKDIYYQDKLRHVKYITKTVTEKVKVPIQETVADNTYERTLLPSLLSEPVITSIAPDSDAHTVTISATNNTGINSSFIAIYYREEADIDPVKPLGIIPFGTSEVTVPAPEWPESESPTFGIRVMVADYTPTSPAASGVTYYTLDNIQMQSSEILWDDGTIPKPPSSFSVVRYKSGIVLATWNWTWADANNAEVSWSTDDIAWESTNGPSTYNLVNLNKGRVYITGLSAGTWYFKVRLYKSTDDTVTYGAYSKTVTINMSSAPNTPTMVLTPNTGSSSTEITATWGYESTDGTPQAYAVLAEATKAEGATTWTYTELPDAVVNTANKFVFTPSQFGWEEGSTHYISVKVTSDSGRESDEWSNPTPLNVAALPTITVTGIGGENDPLHEVTVDVGEEEDDDQLTIPLALTRLPLTFSVSGGGNDGYTSYVIRRVGDYDIDRPDENDVIGYDGEIITSGTIKNVEDTVDITITRENLISTLDYKAKYRLDISVTDRYGQVVYADPYDFVVVWDHYSLIPEATFDFDIDYHAVLITPIGPVGAVVQDKCDIYRLSADRPVLIGSDLAFDEQYVDPYPTYGIFSGYRIVYKSVYGDTKTADNEYAWVDYSPLEGNLAYFSTFNVVLDFDDTSIRLPFNVSVSNSWKKDFTLTRYLGGSMQGDWNYGVERTGSIKAAIPVEYDPDSVQGVRLLADYAGVCHVRTPDGSNFYANVDINDDREEKRVNKVSNVTLSFTKVDNIEADLILYDEWDPTYTDYFPDLPSGLGGLNYIRLDDTRALTTSEIREIINN